MIGRFLLIHTYLFSRAGLDFLGYRMTQIANSLLQSGLEGGASIRGKLYLDSINAFFHNPIIGVGLFSSSQFSIGWHSSLLDLLGSTGVVGGSLFAIFHISVCKKKKKIST